MELVKAVCILIAACMLGNWFMTELKKSRREKKPWYAVYLTIPGILIVTAILLLPFVAWIVQS